MLFLGLFEAIHATTAINTRRWSPNCSGDDHGKDATSN